MPSIRPELGRSRMRFSKNPDSLCPCPDVPFCRYPGWRYGVKLYFTGHHHSFYPGYFQKTHFVSQSCLGSGPTRLDGSDQTSPKSFTVVDFYSDHFEIYALKAPLYLEKVDLRSMPEIIHSRDHVLTLRARSE